MGTTRSSWSFISERKEASVGCASSQRRGSPGTGRRRARPDGRDQRLRRGGLERRVRGGRCHGHADDPAQLRGGRLHKLDRDSPDRRPARQGARVPQAPARLQPERALRGDLQHHTPLRLHERLPRRGERRRRSFGVLKMEDRPLSGSLHSLRGEYEEIQEIYRTRRLEMPEAQVKMNVRNASEKASIIDVEGELTAFAESVLMDAYNQASDGQARAIILNFEDLEYMNSSGIGLLVTLLIRINREKQRLLTYGLSEHYKSIFQITRLDDAITIYDSEEEAVKAANAM